MSALDVRKVRVLRKWISIAEDDLSTARDLMTFTTPHVAKIAFNAQQASEKYLKAWLVFKEFDFPYTHKISTLLDLCKSAGGQQWAEGLKQAEELTHYAVLIRYPLEGEDITMDDAMRAVHIAEKVRSTIRAVLQEGIRNEYEKQTDQEIRLEYEQMDLLNE